MAAAPALRIVHAVRSDAFAGVERSIVLSARALSDRGHAVTVIGGATRIMSAELRSYGIDWVPASSTFDVARRLWGVGRVDVVHAHMTAAESAAILTRGRTGGVLVVTRHFAQRRGRSLSGRLASVAISHVRHQELSISHYVAEAVPEPSLVVHHGIDDRPPSALDARRVVVVQRLDPEKRTSSVLEVWQRARLSDEGWQLVIAGDGAERSMLQQAAKDLGVSRSVQFVGHVDDVDALRRSAAMQLATVSGEHFGLSVLEAMAVGLPVVAADSGAHRELLGEEHAMLLYPPDDIEGAANRLRALAEDCALRSELGTSLRHRQQGQFSLAAHGAALEDAYRRALDAA